MPQHLRVYMIYKTYDHKKTYIIYVMKMNKVFIDQSKEPELYEEIEDNIYRKHGNLLKCADSFH